HYLLKDAFGAPQQLLAAPERYIPNEIPPDLMLEAIGSAGIVQEPEPLVEIGRHRTGQKRVDAGHGIGTRHIDVIAADPDGISDVPQDLISEPFIEAPLQLEFHAIITAIRDGRIHRDIAISLLVIRPGRHGSDLTSRQG